jgi:putative chitinase
VGDGRRFAGRGLIQVTGRLNTLACLAALGRKDDDLDYLCTPMGASRSAAWFWHTRELNAPADQGLFYTVSKKINGGTNGLDDRISHYVRIRKALGI